jgi:hypothetical protein
MSRSGAALATASNVADSDHSLADIGDPPFTPGARACTI